MSQITEARSELLDAVIADTKALLTNLHELLGDWDMVEDYLAGAVAARAGIELEASQPDVADFVSDEDETGYLKAFEAQGGAG